MFWVLQKTLAAVSEGAFALGAASRELHLTMHWPGIDASSVVRWGTRVNNETETNLAAFLADPKTTAIWGATAGFLAGFGWVTLGIATIALFERRSWKYVLINSGYMIVSFTIMGLILGAWR
jgi:hypothetical protein